MLPRITAKQLLPILRAWGWQPSRQKGSHLILVHPELPGIVVVPQHGNEVLRLGTLGSILKQAQKTPEDLLKALERLE